METTHALLKLIIAETTCKPGWRFRCSNTPNEGFRLVITVEGGDAHNEDNIREIDHFFPVPNTTWNVASWREWIFECCRGVENHELGEWFKINGVRPFPSMHGPGENPYVVHFSRPDVDARTLQGGRVVASLD